ncbi:uncharacterized protein [Oryza sativa Japonica Group]|uniref:uncharacterized protein n=1 Tax=Oryza sativa subsp. japonica TaxID=39947 RepID=UPI0007753639|nr:uncharacterized protein LOC4347030 [Oryza sativa Japonica Group]
MAMEAGAPRGAAATTSGGGGGAPEAGAELGSSGAPVTWGRVWRAGQEAAAHALLLCFTALLALKLDGLFRGSWWVLFTPLWLFHAVIARCRFSLPAPSSPQSCQMASCHSIVATPLLVAFELLLCVYLEGHDEPFIDLKLVFLPLLALEIITLVDNFRMCGALMPGHGETMTDEAIWERLPHFWVAISMVFLLAATSLMLLKLCGDAVTLGWWDLFINFGISQCFGFLVCTRWSNPMDIGGPILIIPIVIFQVLLCMRLEGTPSNAKFFPLRAVFLPILLLQVTTVSFAIWIFFERLVTKLRAKKITDGYISFSSKIDELFMMMQHGSRLIAWWSIDEDSKEEQAHLCYANNSGYSTFCSYPPEMVKEMPKKVLVKEVQRLQLALGEQTKMAKLSQQQCDKLKNEQILCRICFERDICIVLLPCRHYVLCEACSDKCRSCPICRVSIENKLPVCDAMSSADSISDTV